MPASEMTNIFGPECFAVGSNIGPASNEQTGILVRSVHDRHTQGRWRQQLKFEPFRVLIAFSAAGREKCSIKDSPIAYSRRPGRGVCANVRRPTVLSFGWILSR